MIGFSRPDRYSYQGLPSLSLGLAAQHGLMVLLSWEIFLLRVMPSPKRQVSLVPLWPSKAV